MVLAVSFSFALYPGSPEERDDCCLASVAGQAGNLDAESTGRGWNKQNGPVIMAGVLRKDRNLPMPSYLWSHKNQWGMYNTNSSDSLALHCKTVFQKTSLRFKYNQPGTDSMGFFLNAKSRFQDWNRMQLFWNPVLKQLIYSALQYISKRK